MGTGVQVTQGSSHNTGECPAQSHMGKETGLQTASLWGQESGVGQSPCPIGASAAPDTATGTLEPGGTEQ